MHKTDLLGLARREAAASIRWPERTPLLVNPDSAVRKRLARLALFLGVTLGLWLALGGTQGPLHDWARSIDNREARASMEAAMNAGNRAAGTWLATHFSKEYPGLLQDEAQAGEPGAMYIVGRVLYEHPHPERFLKVDPVLTPVERQARGLELVRKAATAGNQDALLFAIRHGGL